MAAGAIPAAAVLWVLPLSGPNGFERGKIWNNRTHINIERTSSGDIYQPGEPDR